MIEFRGRPIDQITNAEFLEFVSQHLRMADVVASDECSQNIRAEWLRKVEALEAEGVRRGLNMLEDETPTEGSA